MELEAVSLGRLGCGEELRLGAALLPLRVRMDQAIVEFLQASDLPALTQSSSCRPKHPFLRDMMNPSSLPTLMLDVLPTVLACDCLT